jgi:alpha-tubulin suppressor-like RCC1 family protein
VTTNTNWSRVVAGAAHSCGIRGGQLYCWGDNVFGQLGVFGTADRLVPTQVGAANNWTLVASQWNHTCGLRTGSLYCWGYNVTGQLGDGTTTSPRTTPVLITIPTPWNQVATGFNFSCGIHGTDLYCWGSNSDSASSLTGTAFTGQLGVGDTWSPAPVAVP